MKKVKAPPPELTDDDILAMEVVPVKEAARYLHWTEANVRDCLRSGRAPFGVGFVATGEWVYRIMAKPLVKFKNEGTAVFPFSTWKRLTENVVAAAIEPLVEEIRRAKNESA